MEYRRQLTRAVSLGDIIYKSGVTVALVAVAVAMILAASPFISGVPEDDAVRASQLADPVCALYGWVNDSATLEGIEGVQVVAFSSDSSWYDIIFTNETGYYDMETPREPLEFMCATTGYLPFSCELDATGQSEYRLDIGLEADPIGPAVDMTIEPDANVSTHNILTAHITVEDPNLMIAEVLAGPVWNRTGEWVNFTAVAIGMVAIADDDDHVYGDLEYTHVDDVLDGTYRWAATTDTGGYLRNESDCEPMLMNAVKSIYSEESYYGVSSYYTNDTLTMEQGIAWFDNDTGAYEGFQFRDWLSLDSPGIPDATPDDSSGVITPVRTIYQWRLNSSELGDIYAFFNYTWVTLATRSVVGLTFEFNNVVWSGDYIAVLLAADQAMNTNSTERLFTVDTDPPVADAGGNRTLLLGEALVLDGSASSDNVGIANYTWSIVTDQYDSAEEVYGPEATYPFEDPAGLIVTLTVTDGGGNTDVDAFSVSVDQSPVAEAGPGEMTVPEDSVVTFDGTGSSDDQEIANYSWEVVELVEYSTEAVFTFTFDTPGTYHVELIVVDYSGQVSEPDTILVTVTDETDPVADAGEDLYVEVGDTVTLDGSASYDNVGIITYGWSCDEIETWDSASETGELTTESEGIYHITLEVWDEAGNAGTDSMTIYVSEPNEAPVADAGVDAEITVGDAIQLDASLSTDDGEIQNYTWTFEYDGQTRELYGETVEFVFEVEGTYSVNLTVTDDQGAKGYDEVDITVTRRSTSADLVLYTTAAALALGMIAVAAFTILRRRKAGT
jgi:PKD repeat protein